MMSLLYDHVRQDTGSREVLVLAPLDAEALRMPLESTRIHRGICNSSCLVS